MAKTTKSALPKVISKANKDISTIIEKDIARESELLKDLVDQVLAANMEVKKKNNQRINDTRRRLQELDIEIDELNQSIDLVDRETVLEQLNQMIDAENTIFAARQEIRFYENDHTADKLETIDDIYNNLAQSIVSTSDIEDNYKRILHDNNDLLYDKQKIVTDEILALMDSLYQEKRTFTKDQIAKSNEIKDRVRAIEERFTDAIESHLEAYRQIQSDSSSMFTPVDDDVFIGEKITTDHAATLETIAAKHDQLDEQYQTKRQQIIDQYIAYENGVRAKLEAANKQALEAERQAQKDKDDQLKNIRLLIIDAEKKQDYAKVQSLMKQFDKIEKQNVAKVGAKTDKQLAIETKKIKDKAIQQLLNHELKYVQDKNKQDLAEQLETIKFEEAKILYKIKADHQGLQGDVTINKRLIKEMERFLDDAQTIVTELFDLKLELRLAELEIMRQNELRDHELIATFKTLLQDLKAIEQKRLLLLQESGSNHELIRIEQTYQIDKTILDLRLAKELADIDKLILKTRNESLIKTEKMQEDANSEIIYQESLIKIAQKERELQLKKVRSLYENERSLAEEQFERINLGIQVNDTFVKTTLQNQILFAEQQIQCATSEFDIRVENINLTREQELAYANKKIDYYRQKYEYEKSKLEKERSDKLEDLNFKLLLFTDKRENQSIQDQIDRLNKRYDDMIAAIDKDEQADPQIKRYESVIQAAEQRADQAIEEASLLKDQTVQAFEQLYDQTKAKYNQIEQTSHAQDTAGILPLLNSGAVTSADDRLQRAIKEAEELYEERVKEPLEIINKTKQQLLEMTSDEATEAFIATQKDHKKQAIEDHARELEAIHNQREQSLTETTKAIEAQKAAMKAKLEQEKDALFHAPLYRDEAAINNDYATLQQREQDHFQALLAKRQAFIATERARHVQVLNDTAKLIKATNKPYKKFIRKASRGLNAEKKELVRRNKRQLKKALGEAKDNFTAEFHPSN